MLPQYIHFLCFLVSFRNYAPTIYIQIEALQKHHCQQVLWLYGEDQQITEVGTMNFFMLWINEQGGRYN